MTPTNHALIVGAGPGLGVALARRFGREGFDVTILARRAQALTDLAEPLRGNGINVDAVTADASDPHQFRTDLEDLAKTITPGVVIYNAAVLASDNIFSSDTDYLASTYTVDVLGAVTAAQVFTPAMVRAGAGTFLATGGYPGVDPQPSPRHPLPRQGRIACRRHAHAQGAGPSGRPRSKRHDRRRYRPRHRVRS